MSNFGIKLAYSGVGIGLLLFAGLPFVGMLGPTGGVVYFGAFVICYVVLPLSGLAYDLKSGDFEDREGYQP